jgi:hypothetical protein
VHPAVRPVVFVGWVLDWITSPCMSSIQYIHAGHSRGRREAATAGSNESVQLQAGIVVEVWREIGYDDVLTAGYW